MAWVASGCRNMLDEWKSRVQVDSWILNSLNLSPIVLCRVKTQILAKKWFLVAHEYMPDRKFTGTTDRGSWMIKKVEWECKYLYFGWSRDGCSSFFSRATPITTQRSNGKEQFNLASCLARGVRKKYVTEQGLGQTIVMNIMNTARFCSFR